MNRVLRWLKGEFGDFAIAALVCAYLGSGILPAGLPEVNDGFLPIAQTTEGGLSSGFEWQIMTSILCRSRRDIILSISELVAEL